MSSAPGASGGAPASRSRTPTSAGRGAPLGVQIGQFKTPFTREFITSLAEVETADRAFVVDTLAPKRDIGVMADYAVGGLATFTAGIFNGDGQNVTSNADSSLLGVARAT